MSKLNNYPFVSFVNFVVIVSALFLTCQTNESYCGDEPSMTHNAESVQSNCIAEELFNNIKEYISHLYKLKDLQNANTETLGEEVVFYHSIYFFERNDYKYFTIWTNHIIPPNCFINQNPEDSFKYSLINVLEKDIVLIRTENYNPKLYSCEEISIKEIANNIKKNDLILIYDGSWYPQTYQYYKIDDRFKIVKSDSIIIDFLGEDIIRFEEYLKRINKSGY